MSLFFSAAVLIYRVLIISTEPEDSEKTGRPLMQLSNITHNPRGCICAAPVQLSCLEAANQTSSYVIPASI